MRLQPLLRSRVATLGPAGREWVAALPGVLRALEESWDLEVGRALPGGSGAYVAAALTGDGEERVVKVVVPGLELAGEARILAAAQGRGYAVLHAHDVERAALLLERLGTALELTPQPPERTLTTIAGTLREAWTLPLDTAPTVGPGKDRGSVLHARLRALDDRLGRPSAPRVRASALACAERRAAAFDPAACVVAHGDAHPANILAVRHPRPGAATGHVFVDPDGVRAEPSYDLGIAVRDWTSRLDVPDPRGVVEGYCALLASLTGVDESAIWEWGYLERVVTGLVVLDLGAEVLGRRLLGSAGVLAR